MTTRLDVRTFVRSAPVKMHHRPVLRSTSMTVSIRDKKDQSRMQRVIDNTVYNSSVLVKVEPNIYMFEVAFTLHHRLVSGRLDTPSRRLSASADVAKRGHPLYVEMLEAFRCILAREAVSGVCISIPHSGNDALHLAYDFLSQPRSVRGPLRGPPSLKRRRTTPRTQLMDLPMGVQMMIYDYVYGATARMVTLRQAEELKMVCVRFWQIHHHPDVARIRGTTHWGSLDHATSICYRSSDPYVNVTDRWRFGNIGDYLDELDVLCEVAARYLHPYYRNLPLENGAAMILFDGFRTLLRGTTDVTIVERCSTNILERTSGFCSHDDVALMLVNVFSQCAGRLEVVEMLKSTLRLWGTLSLRARRQQAGSSFNLVCTTLGAWADLPARTISQRVQTLSTILEALDGSGYPAVFEQTIREKLARTLFDRPGGRQRSPIFLKVMSNALLRTMLGLR